MISADTIEALVYITLCGVVLVVLAFVFSDQRWDPLCGILFFPGMFGLLFGAGMLAHIYVPVYL